MLMFHKIKYKTHTNTGKKLILYYILYNQRSIRSVWLMRMFSCVCVCVSANFSTCFNIKVGLSTLFNRNLRKIDKRIDWNKLNIKRGEEKMFRMKHSKSQNQHTSFGGRFFSQPAFVLALYQLCVCLSVAN